jgi:PAS domain S-box-containing protein
MPLPNEFLEALQAPAFATDVAGNVTNLNRAAVTLLGSRLRAGGHWTDSLRMYRPDGSRMTQRDLAAEGSRPAWGVETMIERADGSRAPGILYSSLVTDESGHVVGAFNLLMDIASRARTTRSSARRWKARSYPGTRAPRASSATRRRK